LSPQRGAGENALVVVQCDSCQSKFRIADEKVTDRGVRVRCTSCKNVFQVRKAGAAGSDGTPGPGSTMDLSSLGAAAIARSGSNGTGKPSGAARPASPVKPSTGPVKPSTGPVKPSTGPVKPSTGPVKPKTGPVKPKTGPVRAAAQEPAALDVDDLFGMAELTGDAPLSGSLDPAVPPPPAPSSAPPPAAPAKPAQAKAPEMIDLQFDLDEPPKAARPPPPPPPDPPPAARSELLDPAMPAAGSAGSASFALDDPFAQPALADGGQPAVAIQKALLDEPLARPEPRPKSEPVARPSAAAQARTRTPDIEIAPLRAIVASALTGVLGAALALVVVVVSSLSDDAGGGWLGFGSAAEVVATGVVSGLYDTAGGKPVFYVRGRVENRTRKARGPVRVTAELVADGSPEARGEAIAGSEPTPEDVWSVRSPADADRLSRTLQSARVDRKVAPGASLPFFALISEPPPDLQKHRLKIRIETVDAWTPPAAKAARDK
jgi:predicted Zn finger-like uncharacterized protein